MTAYTIRNTLSGVILGTYEASSEAEALDLMAQDAGYADYAEACKVAPAADSEIAVTVEAKAMTTTETPRLLRIAAVDLNSGYVWGSAMTDRVSAPGRLAGADLIAIGICITETADGSREYDAEISGRYDATTTYRLYVVPLDLVIDDGQDAATIAAVESGEYVGAVRVWDRASHA